MLLMLVCMLAMYVDAGTTDIPGITAHQFAGSMQTWLFLGFLASFAVKVPMWPVHTWLPDAHVEAPTAGSMILAGVLLKMGGYGFLRFSLPMFPLKSTRPTSGVTSHTRFRLCPSQSGLSYLLMECGGLVWNG